MSGKKIKAAIIIQKYYRGYLCRKAMSHKFNSSLTSSHLTHMATKIQKWFKGEIVRKKILRIREAATKIQSFYRMKKAQSSYITIIVAVLRIQSAIRSYSIRSKAVKSRLDEFLSMESALLKNLGTLEQAELFTSVLGSTESPVEEALKTLSTIAEGTASLSQSQLISTGSLAIQSKQVSPFHIEKMYFFTRPLDFELIADDSIVYDPLWSKQFESLNKDLISKEEHIMDVSIGNCHTLAVTSKGRLFAWGWNDKAQCGSKGLKPRLVEGLRDQRIIQITCGDDHSLVLNHSGQVFGFGDNTKGQLGQGSYKELSNVVSIDLPSCKQAVAVGTQNMCITTNNELYLWPFETVHGEKRSYPMKMLSDYQVQEVSVGYNFAMILATSGILFSLGCNNGNGQLGHGDTIPRSSPTMILSLKKQGEKVASVCCGYRHVIARSTLGKLYTWGNGSDGQLGTGAYEHEYTPKTLSLKNDRNKPIQITAGYRNTCIMMENRKILVAGSISQIRTPIFVEANVQNKLPEFFRNQGDFAVVKVQSVWSRLIACILITIVDLRYMKSFQNTQSKMNNVLNTIAAKWTSRSIEPPFIESVAGFYPANLCKKAATKTVMRQSKTLKNPFDDMKDKISEILKKPNDKWTVEEKYMMEHISKYNQ